VVNDLRQLAVAGPLVEVNEVGCDADGPFLIQRQCDELGSVLTVSRSDIYCATATGTPVTIDDQVQTTRVSIDLSIVRWRPAGAVEVYWFVEFDSEIL